MAAFFDKEKLKQDLNQFPSSFDIDFTRLTKSQIQSTSKILDDKRERKKKSEGVDIKITNCLSYLYFLLNEKEHALQLVEESLQKDPDNIIANANKARILLENGEVSEVEEIISKLQESEKQNDYEKRKCYAEADLAYAYSSSGPWYHQRAVELYSRIVDAYPTEYSWQFGLGLALLRRIHRFNSRTDEKFNAAQNENTTVRVAELMLTVAERSDDPILRARAYAKLGKVLNTIDKNKYRDVPKRIRILDAKTCFEKALEYSPEEQSVLHEYGQFLRNQNDLDSSEKFLRKSLEINPTCLGYHQLALTLKRKVQTGRGHSTEHGHLKSEFRKRQVGREGNWRDQQINWRQKSGGLSEKRGQFNQDKYRHVHRTVDDSNHRSQAICHQNTNRLLSSSSHAYRRENGARNYNCNGSDNVTFYDGKDRNDEGRWRKGSTTNTQEGSCNVGKESTGPGEVWRPTRNIPKEGPSSDYVTEPSQKNLRQIIRSPLKVEVDSGNKLLVEAIELLEKAIGLQQDSMIMLYDKGIIYRMLGETKKAVDVFKQIVSERKYTPTQALMTNVYEQLGLCLLELSDSEDIHTEIKQKHKKGGQNCLLHALQLQFEIVANDLQFKEEFNPYSTLNELMNDKRDGQPQELIVLRMRVHDHRDNIDSFNDLFLKEECEMAPDDCIAMLQGYTKAGQLEDCVTLLSYLECTKMFARLPESLTFEVYINAAFHAYSTGNVNLAYKHFRRAFHVYGMFDNVTYRIEADEDDTKKILILHSCSQGWRCRSPEDLGTLLEDCTGLRYTINTDNVLGNANTTEPMVSMMRQISCIIIMTHDRAGSYDQLYVNHAVRMSSEKTGPKVVVVSDDECNVPDITRTTDIPFIPMPPSLDSAVRQNDQIRDEHQEWVKQFIDKLKPN